MQRGHETDQNSRIKSIASIEFNYRVPRWLYMNQLFCVQGLGSSTLVQSIRCVTQRSPSVPKPICGLLVSVCLSRWQRIRTEGGGIPFPKKFTHAKTVLNQGDSQIKPVQIYGKDPLARSSKRYRSGRLKQEVEFVGVKQSGYLL